jgi:hypothetical protein
MHSEFECLRKGLVMRRIFIDVKSGQTQLAEKYRGETTVDRLYRVDESKIQIIYIWTTLLDRSSRTKQGVTFLTSIQHVSSCSGTICHRAAWAFRGSSTAPFSDRYSVFSEHSTADLRYLTPLKICWLSSWVSTRSSNVLNSLDVFLSSLSHREPCYPNPTSHVTELNLFW